MGTTVRDSDTVILPSAEEVWEQRRKDKEAAAQGADKGPEDEIAQAEREEAEEAAGVRQPTVPAAAVKAVAPKTIKWVRVNFEIPGGGTVAVPAIRAQFSPYGLMIILPHEANAMTFIPAAGTTMMVSAEGQRMNCYGTGMAFNIPELNAMAIVLVNAGEEKKQVSALPHAFDKGD